MQNINELNLNQAQECLCFFVIGIIISFIFDIFRSIRKNFSSKDIVTYIEDIIFLSLSTIILMIGIIKISNGILRFYIFFSFFLGILLYSLTISKFCIIILNTVVVFAKKIANLVISIFTKMLNFAKKLGKKLHL